MANPEPIAPITPPLDTEPSEASRAMMRALADRISIPLSTSVGMLEALAADLVGFLREGRFDAFLVASDNLGTALDTFLGTVNESKAVADGIRTLDPNYSAAIDKVRARIQKVRIRRSLASVRVEDLLAGYTLERIAGGGDSTRAQAFREELASRGIEVPK